MEEITPDGRETPSLSLPGKEDRVENDPSVTQSTTEAEEAKSEELEKSKEKVHEMHKKLPMQTEMLKKTSNHDDSELNEPEFCLI